MNLQPTAGPPADAGRPSRSWWSWLAAPQVEDPVEQLRVSALHFYALASLIIAPTWSTVGSGLKGTPASALAIVGAIVTLALLRRGRRKVAGLLFLLLVGGLVAVKVAATGSVGGAAIHQLPIPVLIAASVLGAGSAILVTLLTVGGVLLLAALGHPGMQVPAPSTLRYGASVAAAVLMTGAGLAFLIDHGNRARQQTRNAAVELMRVSRRSAAALRRQRALGEFGSFLVASVDVVEVVAGVSKALAREVVAADREVAVVLGDPNHGGVVRGYANAFAEERPQRRQLVTQDRTIDDLLHEAFAGVEPSEVASRVPIGEGGVLWGGVFVRGAPLTQDEAVFVYGLCSLLVAFAQRIASMTQQRAGFERSAHTHRKEALGEIAVGISHEVNNPNSIIRLSAQLLQKSLRDLRPAFEEAIPADVDIAGMPGDQAMESLDGALTRIESASRKVGEIAQSLGRFVGRHEGAPEPVDLNAVIDDALLMIGNQLRKCWSEIVDNRQPVPKALGRLSDLQLAVVKVLSAAAPPEGKGERLEIQTTCDHAREQIVFTVLFDRGGRDDRADDDTAARSNLAVARQIAEEHGGRLEEDFAGRSRGTLGIVLPLQGRVA